LRWCNSGAQRSRDAGSGCGSSRSDDSGSRHFHTCDARVSSGRAGGAFSADDGDARFARDGRGDAGHRCQAWRSARSGCQAGRNTRRQQEEAR